MKKKFTKNSIIVLIFGLGLICMGLFTDYSLAIRRFVFPSWFTVLFGVGVIIIGMLPGKHDDDENSVNDEVPKSNKNTDAIINNSGIKIISLNTGSHGDHWRSIFGFGFSDSLLFKIVDQSFREKDFWRSGKISLSKKTYEFFDAYILKETDQMVSAFPVLLVKEEYNFKTSTVFTWSHSDNLEAQVSGSEIEIGCGLNFFLVDFSEHKKEYLSQRTIRVGLSGFAYSVKEFIPESNPQGEKFSEDFTGYTFADNDKYKDEYNYVGLIKDITPVFFESEEGYILDLQIVSTDNGGLVIPIFVNRKNIHGTELKVGMKVTGFFWLQGSLISSDI